jgi:hypothetical protein
MRNSLSELSLEEEQGDKENKGFLLLSLDQDI